MKNKKKLEKDVNTLVGAFLAGKMQNGNVCHCAVGTLLQSELNVETEDQHAFMAWYHKLQFWRSKNPDKAKRNVPDCSGQLAPEVDQKAEAFRNTTGYTWEELNRIEGAFEQKQSLEAGLLDAVAVLSDIHGLSEEEGLQYADRISLKVDRERRKAQVAAEKDARRKRIIF